MADKGLLQVYTGDGKGKTTAALGLALRAVGHGWKVCLVQFIKQRPSGEFMANRNCRLFEAIHCGCGFVSGRPTPRQQCAAREGLLQAAAAMSSGDYRLVILDEINNAVSLGLLDAGEVLQAVRARRPEVEVVLTGRDAPPEFLAEADLVSRIEAVKHPFATGTKARRGIEY